MSNTKSSRVINSKAIIAAADFDAAIKQIKSHGQEAKASIKTAVQFIMQQTNYKDQQAAMKTLGQTYMAFKALIGDKSITLASAVTWIRRQAKLLDAKYTFLKSDSAAAKKKAKQRAARQAKAKTDAPAKTEKAKTEKAKTEPASTIVQLRNALIEKELKLQQDYRNVIPAAKVQDFDRAFAAFIQSIELILN